LSGIRRSAIGLEEEQARLQRDSQRGGEAVRLERSQAGGTPRGAPGRPSLGHPPGRGFANSLTDENLPRGIGEGGGPLDQAGKKSVEAGQDLKDAGKAEREAPENAQAGKKGRDQAGKAQEDVRDSLANLAELLDQGEDTWAMRRALERVLSEQKSLRDQTADAAQRTLGKPDAKLTPQERQEPDKITPRQ